MSADADSTQAAKPSPAVAPVSLVIPQKNNRLSSHRRFLVCAVCFLILGITLSSLAYFSAFNIEQAAARDSFESAARRYLQELNSRMDKARADHLLPNANDKEALLQFFEKEKVSVPAVGLNNQFMPENILERQATKAMESNPLVYADYITLGNEHWGFLSTARPGFFSVSGWTGFGVLLIGCVITLFCIIASYLLEYSSGTDETPSPQPSHSHGKKPPIQ